MTSRLYPTTRRLFKQVFQALKSLGLGAVVSPLSFVLMAVYIAGLLLLDRRQNGTRMASWLPLRYHDAINRLLRTHQIFSRSLMKMVIAWAKRVGKGHLSLDDVVVEKPFSKLCNWMGWTYSTTHQRKVFDFHVVVLMFCCGCWRIPVAYRLWRPKAKCRPKNYRKKSQLAWEMIVEVVTEGLKLTILPWTPYIQAVG